MRGVNRNAVTMISRTSPAVSMITACRLESIVGDVARYRAAAPPFSVTFWTRQLVISPISSSFSLRQSIELARPNSFGSLPADAELADHLAVERAPCRWRRPPCRRRRRRARCRDTASRRASCTSSSGVPTLPNSRLERAVGVEHLDALVAGVGDVDVALRRRWRSPSRRVNCPGSVPVEPQCLMKRPSLSNLATRLLSPMPSAT